MLGKLDIRRVVIADRSIAVPYWERGKSGQRRASCFLTGRCSKGHSSVTEKNRSIVERLENKGEKVR